MKNKWLLLITILGFLIRLVNFPLLPAEMNRDELALGYNAYSILQTGKDEYGKSFPIVFRSFGDYKLPVYVYLLAPFVQAFGVTALAVRLPSFIAGVLLIPVLYWFVFSLFRNTSRAVWSSAVLACSPWAIFYSHVGYEAHVGLLLFVLGITLLLKKKDLIGGLILFLSAMTYNAPLLILPFLIITLFFSKKISKKSVVVATLVFLSVTFITYPISKGKSSISFLGNAGFEQMRQDKRIEADTVVERVYLNPIVYYPSQVLLRFGLSFSPSFLVSPGGANPWHQVSGYAHLGALYPVFIFSIVFFLVRRKEFLLLILLSVSLIPAVITLDAPHATRSLLFLLLSGVTMGVLISESSMRMKYVFVGLLAISAGSYVYIYGIRMKTPQYEWKVGIRQAILEAEQMRQPEEVIYLIDSPEYAYVYPLVITGYSSNDFRREDAFVEAFGHWRIVQTLTEIQGNGLIVEPYSTPTQTKYQVVRK